MLGIILLSGCIQRQPSEDNAVKRTSPVTELKGEFSVSGAYALTPLAKKWAAGFMKLHPGVRIEVVRSGTGQGIEDLITGKSRVALISRQLKEEDISAGIWTVPVAKEGVAPIISSGNPYLERILSRGLSTDEFLKVFAGDKPVTWGELLDTTGKEVVVAYSRADEAGAADVWAEFLYRRTEDLRGKKITGDIEMVKAVSNDPYAIGYCNFSYAFNIENGMKLKEVNIIPFDLDFDNIVRTKEVPFSTLEKAHRSLWLGIYPKSLCRELSLGSVGKPSDPLIIEFIRYTLTEGQKEVTSVGLCELNDVYISYSLDKLK